MKLLIPSDGLCQGAMYDLWLSLLAINRCNAPRPHSGNLSSMLLYMYSSTCGSKSSSCRKSLNEGSRCPSDCLAQGWPRFGSWRGRSQGWGSKDAFRAGSAVTRLVGVPLRASIPKLWLAIGFYANMREPRQNFLSHWRILLHARACLHTIQPENILRKL